MSKVINGDKSFCYRITHIDNLPHILDHGILNKNHPKASDGYIQIGHPEIIDVRSTTKVKIENYGNIGDYVPFYFTPKSIMLYNIQTGHQAPKVTHRNAEDLLVIRCKIQDLAAHDALWFFTDGQANDAATRHYNDLSQIDAIDWETIHACNFKKSDGNRQRPRKYQAEFLVHKEVPVHLIESFCVHNDNAAQIVQDLLENNNFTHISVHTLPQYYF
jgi:hypothetical protein